MPMENRAKLVAALRSGEYTQTDGVLTRITTENIYGVDSILKQKLRKESHCCLGVACELAYKENVVKVRMVCAGVIGRSEIRVVNYDTESYTLPQSVMDWLGIQTPQGEFLMNDGQRSSLAKMNDSGATFDQIADIIEKVDSGMGEWLRCSEVQPIDFDNDDHFEDFV